MFTYLKWIVGKILFVLSSSWVGAILLAVSAIAELIWNRRDISYPFLIASGVVVAGFIVRGVIERVLENKKDGTTTVKLGIFSQRDE